MNKLTDQPQPHLYWTKYLVSVTSHGRGLASKALFCTSGCKASMTLRPWASHLASLHLNFICEVNIKYIYGIRKLISWVDFTFWDWWISGCSLTISFFLGLIYLLTQHLWTISQVPVLDFWYLACPSAWHCLPCCSHLLILQKLSVTDITGSQSWPLSF